MSNRFVPFTGRGHRLSDDGGGGANDDVRRETPGSSSGQRVAPAPAERAMEPEVVVLEDSDPAPPEQGGQDKEGGEEEEEGEEEDGRDQLIQEGLGVSVGDLAKQLSDFASMASAWIAECPPHALAGFIRQAEEVVDNSVCVLSWLPNCETSNQASQEEVKLYKQCHADFQFLHYKWTKIQNTAPPDADEAGAQGDDGAKASSEGQGEDTIRANGDDDETEEMCEPESLFQEGCFQD